MIGKFPLAANDLNENYAPMIKGNRFIPLSAFDDSGNLAGHLFIRYPNESDDSIVGFQPVGKLKFTKCLLANGSVLEWSLWH